MKKYTLPEIKDLMPKWFDTSSMAFFNSKIESDVLKGNCFISSEQAPGCTRLYTIRAFNGSDISDIGGFQAFASVKQAKAYLFEEEMLYLD